MAEPTPKRNNGAAAGFRVVDEAARAKPSRRIEGSVAAELRAGKTLFFEGKGSSFGGGWTALMSVAGYKLHRASRTVDGARGLVMWAEPIKPRP